MSDDLFDDRVQVVPHLPLREADDSEALGFEPGGAFLVAHLAFRQLVMRTIHLDDQARCKVGEVGDVAADGGLATEVHLQLPQGLPKDAFGDGLLPAKTAGAKM